jgi:hypothetical protein
VQMSCHNVYFLMDNSSYYCHYKYGLSTLAIKKSYWINSCGPLKTLLILAIKVFVEKGYCKKNLTFIQINLHLALDHIR